MMSRVILILISLFISVYIYAQEHNQPIRAGQVFYSEAQNYIEFEKEIAHMKSLEINTIIFRMFGNKGDRIYKFANPKTNVGVYFKTSRSPVIDDLLGNVTALAHKHGIKVFAWMTTRHATYGAVGDVMDREYSLSTRQYQILPKLDLFNDKAIWELQNLYMDLAKYPIDGVLIQDDFVMRHMEGFGSEARVNYANTFKRTLDAKNMYSDLELQPNGRVKRIVYTDEFWQFQDWKNKRLNLVAEKLIKALKDTNPKLEVALNVSYELFYKPKNALTWFAHDKTLARKFNYVAVMAYQDQMMKELRINLNEAGALITDNTRNAVKVMGSPERVIMKIQTMDWDTRRDLPSREVSFIYQKVESASPDVGIALVPWENRVFSFIKRLD